MNAVNFAYWLQGYLELTSAGDKDFKLTDDQVKMIQRHLAMVFQHDIDPATEPDPAKAGELQRTHDGIPGLKCVADYTSRTYRC